MSPTIGVLKPGSTYAGMIERFGDYDAWFTRALAPSGTRTRTFDATGPSLPEHDAADGWIVTGARSSVVDGGPAVDRLLAWIEDAVRRETPILGVCWGHQALLAALGADVERHAAGWEIGTAEVKLTPAGRDDPLFQGLPERFLVQTTHEDHVPTVPAGTAVLAENPHTPVQAVAAGPRARGVQFHPEVTVEIARDFVDRRRHLLFAEPRLEDAPLGRRVLENFARAFVGDPARR